jgi:hypothetical protein
MPDFSQAFREAEAKMVAHRKERSATVPPTVSFDAIRRDRADRERAERERRAARDLTEPRYQRALELSAKHHREHLVARTGR